MINYMQQLQQIALTNPRLAVALLRSNVSQPQAYVMRTTFASGAVNQPVSAQFGSPVTEDFWVYDIAYTLNMPKLYVGNVFRPFNQVQNAIMPGIDAQFSVNGGVGLPWLFSESAMPIELLARCAVGPATGPVYGQCNPFVMFFPQVVKGNFVLTRQYADTDDGIGEIPAILSVAFTGLALGVQAYGGLTVQQSRVILDSEYGRDRPDIIAEHIADRLAARGVQFPTPSGG